MAQAVVCPQCGKRYLVPDAYRGRAKCPHCSTGRTERPSKSPPPAPAPRANVPAPRPAAPAAGGPASGGTKRHPGIRLHSPAPTAEAAVSETTRAAREAWDQAARRRRREPWPPPRSERAPALRRRQFWTDWRHGLLPYLILLAALAVALAVFALIAARHQRAEPQTEAAQARFDALYPPVGRKMGSDPIFRLSGVTPSELGG